MTFFAVIVKGTKQKLQPWRGKQACHGSCFFSCPRRYCRIDRGLMVKQMDLVFQKCSAAHGDSSARHNPECLWGHSWVLLQLKQHLGSPATSWPVPAISGLCLDGNWGKSVSLHWLSCCAKWVGAWTQLCFRMLEFNYLGLFMGVCSQIADSPVQYFWICD